MGFYVAALPVRPGKEGRAKTFSEEMKRHDKRYEELNKAAGVKRHLEFLQEASFGSHVITIFEADDPTKLARAFGSDAYDTWWVERIKEIHGADIKSGFTPPKITPLFEWTAPGVK